MLTRRSFFFSSSGTYRYGGHAAQTGELLSFECATHTQDTVHVGIGCSTGGGNKWKVLSSADAPTGGRLACPGAF